MGLRFIGDGKLYRFDAADWGNLVIKDTDIPASTDHHWDQYSKCLSLHMVSDQREIAGNLYFDGEQLLFYENDGNTPDVNP